MAPRADTCTEPTPGALMDAQGRRGTVRNRAWRGELPERLAAGRRLKI